MTKLLCSSSRLLIPIRLEPAENHFPNKIMIPATNHIIYEPKSFLVLKPCNRKRQKNILDFSHGRRQKSDVGILIFPVELKSLCHWGRLRYTVHTHI